jgi:hypothetical protein
MKTKTLVMLSAAIEAATGIVLIAVPDLAARVLLGTELSNSGIAVARLAGCGLFALGLACWPGSENATPQATRSLFVYNLVAGLYLGYLRVGGGFTGALLWPACVFHVLMALLFARPAYASVKQGISPNNDIAGN